MQSHMAQRECGFKSPSTLNPLNTLNAPKNALLLESSQPETDHRGTRCFVDS